jgi:hypothetical protein
VAQRQKEGVANGTINRELAVLSKMLRLAYENGKLLRLPVVKKLKEAPPRSGSSLATSQARSASCTYAASSCPARYSSRRSTRSRVASASAASYACHGPGTEFLRFSG